MRKLLLLLLCTYGLTAAIASDSRSVREEVDADVWSYACEYMRVFHDTSCKGLKPPRILYSEFRWTNNGKANIRMRGIYWHGSKYITLNIKLLGKVEARSVMLHESVHYIIDNNKLAVDSCRNEEIARQAHHSFDKTPYSDEWKRWYGCQKPK